MDTIHVRTRSDANGILHLDIPVSNPDIEFDITVTLEPCDLNIQDNENSAPAVNNEENYEDLDDLLCD